MVTRYTCARRITREERCKLSYLCRFLFISFAETLTLRIYIICKNNDNVKGIIVKGIIVIV
jgi:hypothetical protein